MKDAKEALRFDPKNVKALFRAAKACSKTRKWAECVAFAEQGLALEPGNEALKTEHRIASGILASVRAREQAEQDKKQALERELRKRGIKMEPLSAETGGAMADRGPRLEDGEIVWTVLIAADEMNIVDVADAVSENASLRDVLSHMYEQAPQWSSQYRYSRDMELYYSAPGRWVRVNLDSLLGNVLQQRDLVVHGVPTFHLIRGNSPFKKQFLAVPPPDPK